MSVPVMPKENRLTIQQLFKHTRRSGHVGLELEVESTRDIPPWTSNIWEAKADHSLRNFGVEYTTRGPINVDHRLKSRISELTSMVSQIPGILKDCTRTSFHVHLNVQDNTLTEVWTIATAYLLLEQSLMEFCGSHRVGNMYCLRAKDAEAQIEHIFQLLKHPFAIYMYDTDNMRYASQNLKAIATHGTLEYRGMRGSLDAETLYLWVYTLKYLSEAALKYKDPVALLTAFDQMPREAFLKTLLPGAMLSIVLNQPNYSERMSEQFDMLFPLLYEIDWSRFKADTDQPPPPPPPPPPLPSSRVSSTQAENHGQTRVINTTDTRRPPQVQSIWGSRLITADE